MAASEITDDDVRCRYGFQLGQCPHRIFVEIEAPRLDQIEQQRGPQPMALDGGEQRGGDRIGIRLAVSLAADRFAPPLQADLARQGRMRNIAHAR